MKNLFAIVIAVLLAATLYIYAGKQGNSQNNTTVSTGTASIGGAFSLVDQDAKAVTEKMYRGKYMLIFFGFTNCPDVCLIAANTMGQAMKKLSDAQRAKLNMLFVTLDPERDTPLVMKKWLNDYDARMIGLTGTKEQVDAAKAAFKVYSQIRRENPEDKNYRIDHSSYMYLMDEQGQYLAHFPHNIALDKLLEGIQKFL